MSDRDSLFSSGRNHSVLDCRMPRSALTRKKISIELLLIPIVKPDDDDNSQVVVRYQELPCYGLIGLSTHFPKRVGMNIVTEYTI